MPFSKAIGLNNKGVSFLRNGNVKEAQRCFVQAINGILCNGENEPFTKRPEPSPETENETNDSVHHQKQIDDQCEECESRNSALPLHLQGVLLSEDDFIPSNDDIIVCGVLGAAVLFNFAVSHHVLAVFFKNRHQPTERRFLCAQQLYKSAQHSLAVAVGDATGQKSQQNLVQYLFLATANNSGMIALEMADYENAREAFECIDYYCRLFDCKRAGNDLEEDDRNEQMEALKSFFLLNALCYCNTMQAAAA